MRMRAGIAVAAALGIWAAAAGAAQEAPLGWMVGDWHEAVAGQWTSEHWQPAEDGVMRGASASGHDQIVSSREAMHITLTGATAVFTASPNGAPPVDFPELSRGPQEIVFANDAHDYPQRIRYWREGDVLMAEISLKDGSKPMRWRYVRMR